MLHLLKEIAGLLPYILTCNTSPENGNQQMPCRNCRLNLARVIQTIRSNVRYTLDLNEDSDEF